MDESTDWQLEVIEEAKPPRQHLLKGTDWVIGRSTQADIQFDLPTVSRKHARLIRVEGRWQIEDLASRGGTWFRGERIDKKILHPGEWLTISRFRFRLIDPAHRPEDGEDSSAYFKEDTSPPDISVLTAVINPKLGISHINALSEFGKELMQLETSQQRLDHLCAIVSGDMIHGRWALALRLDADATNQPPKLLASHPKDVQKTTDLHISRSTIRAMQEAGSPVLSSNSADLDQGMVEMSIVSTAPATAAIACPLSDEPGSHELLYVNLPPTLGSTEWLALVALAVKQYQQAEAVWSAKEAVAVRTAVERDLKNARQIQESILPSPLTGDRVEVAWSYLPCETIGGDLIDVIEMPDGRVLLIIADVTGHGLPAALTTLSVHSIVQTCIHGGMPLNESISRLNDHLARYLPDGRFVTLAAVVLNPTTGETRCLCAGHHPPVVYGADGSQRDLNYESDLVLGIHEVEYVDATDKLKPGDTLFLSTDGLTELSDDAGDMLGIEGVNDLVGSIRAEQSASLDEDQPIAALANQIEQRFKSIQADRPMLDDQTFLIAIWRG